MSTKCNRRVTESDKKNTVVLMWNPAISSVKEKDYREWFEGIGTFNEKLFNWSIHDHAESGFGDRFVLIRVGEGSTGLMMDGMIISDCRKGKDWSGRGREVFYADLIPMKAFNPENGAEFPTTDMLAQAVPDFNWSGGHSGQILTPEQAEALDVFLKEYYKKHSQEERKYDKMRSRDYVVSASSIYPSEKDLDKNSLADPRPFIESSILRAIGIEPAQLEEKWKEHDNVWVRDKEYLLRAAAEMAFPIRKELPYYGALCLKLADQYFGSCKENINAAYAREAADYLQNPKLRHRAVMKWLSYSLPEVKSRIKGMEFLKDYLPHIDFDADHNMLHDFSVTDVSTDWMKQVIEITISDTGDPKQVDAEKIVFRLTGHIDIDFTCDSNGFNYITEAHIGAWSQNQIAVVIDGFGLKARGDSLEILPGA